MPPFFIGDRREGRDGGINGIAAAEETVKLQSEAAVALSLLLASFSLHCLPLLVCVKRRTKGDSDERKPYSFSYPSLFLGRTSGHSSLVGSVSVLGDSRRGSECTISFRACVLLQTRSEDPNYVEMTWNSSKGLKMFWIQ